MPAGDTSHYVLWEELALPACAACARWAAKSCETRDVARKDIRLNKVVEQLDSTVLSVAFHGLSASMQASLLKHKASKLKLR